MEQAVFSLAMPCAKGLLNQALIVVGLLTIYDMCKAADRGMVITDVALLEKQGGRSGHWVRGTPN